MRVDDLFITEDISVLDAMRKLDETGLGVLFVAPEARGRGVGRALLAHAVEHARVRTLDVNEQNPQAVGFYEHEGFVVAGRSPVDDAGRPFPLLHMRLV